MAAKKTAKKAAKKTAKKAAKKASAKKAAKKTTAAKSATKAAANPAQKAAEKPPEVAAEAAPAAAAVEEPAAKAAAGEIKSADVNLGHIFALRPRVATSFKPNDFRTAKQQLDEERYASLSDAARAVAEKALELTTDGPPGSRRRRRW